MIVDPTNPTDVKKEQPKRYLSNCGWIDPKTLPVDEDGYRCCRYCNQPIKEKRRRTFCSADCVDQYRIRSSGSYLRKRVYMRDRGVCSMCGLDTKILARQILSYPEGSAERICLMELHNISLTRKIKQRKNGGGLWDADHIVNVQHGGGCCGLDNLRTLCIQCHKNVTFGKNK
jgi:5-methylcytosine-specific restriction protein A